MSSSSNSESKSAQLVGNIKSAVSNLRSNEKLHNGLERGRDAALTAYSRGTRMAEDGVEWVKQNPKKTIAIVAPIVVFGGLYAAGFHATGPVAGSTASKIMSLYGAHVPAGGLYACAQSAGMSYATMLKALAVTSATAVAVVAAKEHLQS